MLASSLALAAAKPLPGVPANCPARAKAVHETFMRADCMDCWKGKPLYDAASPERETEWFMDWIVPTADDADMAPGALSESVDRLERTGARPLHLPATLTAEERATAPFQIDAARALEPPSARHRFYVHSSLPHNGYMGVQLHAAGVWPAGSTAWIALVELIPAGVRDTPVPRRLVRVVVGPLAMPAGPGAKNAIAPLYGLRWPENAHPDQLVATAWVENADGRITQMASDRCVDPK